MKDYKLSEIKAICESHFERGEEECAFLCPECPIYNEVGFMFCCEQEPIYWEINKENEDERLPIERDKRGER